MLMYISGIESSETLEELKEALVDYIQNGEDSSTKDRVGDIEARLDSATIEI